MPPQGEGSIEKPWPAPGRLKTFQQGFNGFISGWCCSIVSNKRQPQKDRRGCDKWLWKTHLGRLSLSAVFLRVTPPHLCWPATPRLILELSQSLGTQQSGTRLLAEVQVLQREGSGSEFSIGMDPVVPGAWTWLAGDNPPCYHLTAV